MTQRDRRALQVGAAIVLSVTTLRLAPAVGGWMRAQRRLATESARTLAAAQAAVAGRPTVRDSLNAALTAYEGLAPRLVPGATHAEASANLTALVSAAAGRASLRVARLDPLPDSSAGPFGRAAIHAELEGDVAGLVGLIVSIERGAPMLSIRAFSVQAVEPVPRLQAQERLRVELEVAGWYLAEDR